MNKFFTLAAISLAVCSMSAKEKTMRIHHADGTSTTIAVEASDECPAPFYKGVIVTEDGNIDIGATTGTGGAGTTGGSGSGGSIIDP